MTTYYFDIMLLFSLILTHDLSFITNIDFFSLKTQPKLEYYIHVKAIIINESKYSYIYTEPAARLNVFQSYRYK